MNVSEVGKVAADLMDAIADEHPDEDVEVGAVAVVVELNAEEWCAIRYRCNDGRRWIQAALFEQAKLGVHNSAWADLDKDHPEEDDED